MGNGHAVKTNPTRLVLLCEVCSKPVHGDAGFLCVDRRAAASAGWRILHRDCCPQAVALMSPFFRIWGSRVQTTDQLLDTMASMSQLPWFAGSGWGALCRRVLADTQAHWAWVKAHGEKSARRREPGERQDLPPDDPRHGENGYAHYGCRCEICRQAHSDRSRAARSRLAPDDPRHGSLGGYQHHGCRCDRCTEFNTAYYRGKRYGKAGTPDDQESGLESRSSPTAVAL